MKAQVAGSIEAVTLGLDLTLRGLQSELKANGHPWEVILSSGGSLWEKFSIFEMVKADQAISRFSTSLHVTLRVDIFILACRWQNASQEARSLLHGYLLKNSKTTWSTILNFGWARS